MVFCGYLWFYSTIILPPILPNTKAFREIVLPIILPILPFPSVLSKLKRRESHEVSDNKVRVRPKEQGKQEGGCTHTGGGAAVSEEEVHQHWREGVQRPMEREAARLQYGRGRRTQCPYIAGQVIDRHLHPRHGMQRYRMGLGRILQVSRIECNQERVVHRIH